MCIVPNSVDFNPESSPASSSSPGLSPKARAAVIAASVVVALCVCGGAVLRYLFVKRYPPFAKKLATEEANIEASVNEDAEQRGEASVVGKGSADSITKETTTPTNSEGDEAIALQRLVDAVAKQSNDGGGLVNLPATAVVNIGEGSAGGDGSGSENDSRVPAVEHIERDQSEREGHSPSNGVHDSSKHNTYANSTLHGVALAGAKPLRRDSLDGIEERPEKGRSAKQRRDHPAASSSARRPSMSTRKREGDDGEAAGSVCHRSEGQPLSDSKFTWDLVRFIWCCRAVCRFLFN